MRASSLKEGIVLTPKPKHFICELDFSSLDKSEITPWIIVSQKSIMKSLSGDGEAILYLRTVESQLRLSIDDDSDTSDAEISSLLSTQRRCYHEVLWRGSVYRMRNNTLRRLDIVKNKQNKKVKKVN